MAQNSKPKKWILLTPKLDDFRFISTRSLDPYPNEATHQNPISTLVFAYYSPCSFGCSSPYSQSRGVWMFLSHSHVWCSAPCFTVNDPSTHPPQDNHPGSFHRRSSPPHQHPRVKSGFAEPPGTAKRREAGITCGAIDTSWYINANGILNQRKHLGVKPQFSAVYIQYQY